MKQTLTLKAHSISELELQLKVNHGVDLPQEKYQILSQESPKGIKKIFGSKITFVVSIGHESPLDTLQESVVKEEKVEKERLSTPHAVESQVATKEVVFERISRLLEMTGLAVVVESIEEKQGTFNVILAGESKGLIIGTKGKTLYSLEHLINQFFGYKHKKIFLNIESFKEKRQETVERLAESVARKVLRFKKPIQLNFMPANERKMIHEIISSYPELESISEGKSPKRYVVIQLKRGSNV